ncbi:MAG TPA: nucleoside triphosphate pyrophosphohydrolase [Synergistaceae bacterium]|nr:nucleoside triphosphate pyrophosphohydrolase [Synergistaceae bacterium]
MTKDEESAPRGAVLESLRKRGEEGAPEGGRRDPGASFSRLLEVMARLRDPGGCPWDREQTWESLKPYVVEEAYELLDAIDSSDDEGIREESGDLLLQTVFIAQIAREEGRFDMGDVLEGLVEKLVRRHPHVFSDVSAETSDAVLRHWERIKSVERRCRGKDLSMLGGIPRSLPALLRAYQMQHRAAKVGFDWPQGDPQPVLNKVQEEIEELREALIRGDKDQVAEEMGDLLFAMVNFGRHLGIDAESALQAACHKFARRFGSVEEAVRLQDRPWESFSLEELEEFWGNAKASERGPEASDPPRFGHEA